MYYFGVHLFNKSVTSVALKHFRTGHLETTAPYYHIYIIMRKPVRMCVCEAMQ